MKPDEHKTVQARILEYAEAIMVGDAALSLQSQPARIAPPAKALA